MKPDVDPRAIIELCLGTRSVDCSPSDPGLRHARAAVPRERSILRGRIQVSIT